MSWCYLALTNVLNQSQNPNQRSPGTAHVQSSPSHHLHVTDFKESEWFKVSDCGICQGTNQNSMTPLLHRPLFFLVISWLRSEQKQRANMTPHHDGKVTITDFKRTIPQSHSFSLPLAELHYSFYDSLRWNLVICPPGNHTCSLGRLRATCLLKCCDGSSSRLAVSVSFLQVNGL